MKKSWFTEAQIVFALLQAESGVTVAEVCRKLDISEATSTLQEEVQRPGSFLRGWTSGLRHQVTLDFSWFLALQLRASR